MGKLDELVRGVANGSIVPNIEDEIKKNRHIDICKGLVELSDEYKVPMSFLVYFAVNKAAHKPSTLEKGYEHFDKDKAVAIIGMAQQFAEKHGMNKPSDKVYHAMTAFYERKSTVAEEFKTILGGMKPHKKFATTRSICMQMGM